MQQRRYERSMVGRWGLGPFRVGRFLVQEVLRLGCYVEKVWKEQCSDRRKDVGQV